MRALVLEAEEFTREEGSATYIHTRLIN